MTQPGPERALIAAAVERARELDTSAIRRALEVPDGPYRWPRFRVNEVELEWRRWRIRRQLNAGDDPPGSVRLFERLAGSAGLPAAEPAREGPLTRLSYDEMFPQGPLITKARPARVGRPGPAAPPDPGRAAELTAAELTAAARRRRAYLTRLPVDGHWWLVPDLLSERARRVCAAEVATLPPGGGAGYQGGPAPGWDLAHDALVSQSCNAYLGAGPALIHLHEDPELVALISARMGRRMYPTRCTYLRYRRDDYLGVHTDQPTCEVSLMFTVDGEAGPMRSYLDRTGDDPATLHRWIAAHGHFPEGGQDFVYRPREGLALTGRAVPHARLPQPEPAIIGALFYSGLS
jgi:hypothetical protein